VPTAGTPPTFSSYAEFEAFYETMIAARSVTSMKDFWWDIRPSPGFGTLEIRICDAPSTLRETLAIVALVQCLCAETDAHLLAGETPPRPPAWLLRENKWRAARHGLDAEVVVGAAGETRRVRDDLARLVRELAPVGARMGCSSELRDVEHVLDAGAGYERQRRVYASSRTLGAVMSALVHEWRTGELVNRI
jgi:carboxylate-amine ligase